MADSFSKANIFFKNGLKPGPAFEQFLVHSLKYSF
jgi:hypothetical protein